MPRTAAQNEAIRDKRKDKIITKTVKLFATKGFDTITIDDISKASNCAHGLFYHYFEVKEDLYNAIVTQFETKYASKVLNFNEIEKLEPLDAIKAIIHYYHSVLDEADVIVCYSRLALNKFYQCGTATKALSGIDLYDEIKKIIKKGQENGTLKQGNSDEYAKVLVGLFLTETELRLSVKDGFTPINEEFMLSLVA